MDNQISTSELSERLGNAENLNLLDVREVIEFHTYNIGGKNIPLAEIDGNIDKCGYNKTAEIIVICTVGLRSKTAVDILTKKGYSNTRNLTGGLMALQKIKP
jgi:adenylyltransferase/sulfurtransferase